MRDPLSLVTTAVIYSIPSLAFAHSGQSFGDDHGVGLLWFYAIALAGIVGLIVLRIFLRSTRRPGHRRISRRLAELETALTSNLATLRDAEDYPSECGLGVKERQSRLDAVAAIRQLIKEEKLRLASAKDGSHPVTT